jgi:hypothetical protein
MAKSFPNTGATVIDATADLPGSPSEGMMVFQKDTNELKIYDGSVWVSVLDTDAPPGMVLLSTGTVSNSHQTFTSVFSATYENYFITFRGICPTTTSNIDCQLMSGATLISGNYTNQWMYATGTSVTAAVLATTSAKVGAISSAISGVSCYVYGPFLASQTVFSGSSSLTGRFDVTGSTHSLATSYDGIKFTADVDQPTRFLTGTFKVYGLK